MIAVDVCTITVFFSNFKISSVFFKTFILKIKNKQTNEHQK